MSEYRKGCHGFLKPSVKKSSQLHDRLLLLEQSAEHEPATR